MPAVNPNNASAPPQRTSFRPPWVKEGPTPLPLPSAPWTARAREATANSEQVEPAKPGPRKLSKVMIIPSQPSQDQELLSQAHLKWNPKASEKDSRMPIVNSQPPIIKEKKQETFISSLTPTILSPVKDKRHQAFPVDSQNKPQPANKEKDLYSQANLKKTTPRPNEKGSKNTAPFSEPQQMAIISAKEGPGEPSGRRKESTTIPVVVESKRRESTPKAPEKRRESLVTIKEPEKQLKASREFAKPVPRPVDKEPIVPKSILKDPSKSSVSRPPPPPAPPAPPAPPTPPMGPPIPPPPPPGFKKNELTPVKSAKLEALRSRPRRRPDWTDMMKEVEGGRKLKHVQCNDRSAPVLPKEKSKGPKGEAQFVYDSEKAPTLNPHKKLLDQIQGGIRLKKVKCNDRSKPNLDGLRKFRRQMTVEEQIHKSMSMADVIAAAAEPDELDDIDKVRDDLQSSKQMLAQELRNKEALERENKRLMARLLNLEVELEKEKNAKSVETLSGKGQAQATSAADEQMVQQLKEEAAQATCTMKEMEEKYHNTAEELDSTRAKLESAWLRNQQLEIELKAAGRPVVPRQASSKRLAASSANLANGRPLGLAASAADSDDESEYTDETVTESETESEEDGDEVDSAAVQERRIARELKLLATKLRSYKDKQSSALKERRNLREQLRKQQRTLRQEKKKFKELQKEVDKMAKLMKDDEDEEEEEDEEKTEEPVPEEESESESEESSEEEEASDGELPETASVDAKRKNLTERAKRYETRLGTLKKGNYLLKANVDRLQDDVNRQREMSLTMQEDLNSVLAELG